MLAPPRAVALATAAAVCLTTGRLVARTAATLAPDAPVLVLHAYNYAQVAPDILDRAQKETCRVYREAGVGVQWVDQTAPFECGTDGPLHLAVAILSQEMTERKGAREDAMGVAPGTVQQRGRMAYIFYDRVADTAARHGQCVSEILGSVIAHEVGHLLLPYGSHSGEGVMRGEWDQRQIQLAAISALSFTPPQRQAIRSTLTRRIAAADHETSTATVDDPQR